MNLDPAAIDRTTPLPVTCSQGAGRSPEEVVIPVGTSVTLCCPVTGIEQPEKAWYRVEVDEYGMGMEMLVTTGVTYVCSALVKFLITEILSLF